MKKNTCKGDVKQLVYLVLAIFIISLTVLSVVFIVNQIKESKYIGRDNIQRSTISVSGTGEVSVVPDLATISFSVVVEGETSAEVTEASTEKMNAIIKVIKGQDVEEKDIKTTNYSLQPVYDYDDEDRYYIHDEERELVGYRLSQTLQIKIRDLDNSGEIIRVATEAGADQVGGLSFTIDDEEDLQIEARELAIQDAKAKAELLAGQLGVSLVKIMYFSENSYPYYSYAKAEMAMDSAGGSIVVPTPDIEPGENTVTVNVDITYEIN